MPLTTCMRLRDTPCFRCGKWRMWGLTAGALGTLSPRPTGMSGERLETSAFFGGTKPSVDAPCGRRLT